MQSFTFENRIVTLLTDFGLQDVYVGVMKGVIAKINPQLKVIDLTHQISPQNLAAARFCLMNAYAYFPQNTVHIAVVDPGVGSQRRNIAIKFRHGYLVGPDNGIFSGVLSLSDAIEAVELTNSDYWLTPHPSTTFHGRDIFASVGAHLATGVSLTQLGTTINLDSLVTLPLPKFEITHTGIIGTIQYIDIFGNLITNIPNTVILPSSWSVIVKDLVIPCGKTYSDIKIGEILAFFGSHGWLEIAVNCASAQEKLHVTLGEKIQVIF